MNLTIAANDTWTPGDMRAELHARDLQLFAHLRQAAEIRDPNVASHMLRMSQYARLIATRLGLSHGEQETVLAANPFAGQVGCKAHPPARFDCGALSVEVKVLHPKGGNGPYLAVRRGEMDA